VEAAEQDAAIRGGKKGGFPPLRLHRLRIATFAAEDDQRTSRQVVGLSAVLKRNLLRAWGGVAFLALATRPAVATRLLDVRVNSLAARVACRRRLGGTRCLLTAAAASNVP